MSGLLFDLTARFDIISRKTSITNTINCGNMNLYLLKIHAPLSVILSPVLLLRMTINAIVIPTRTMPPITCG